MRGFEDIGSKGRFLAKNHIMSPQAMYFWPKNSQNGKTRIFLDTTLTLNDSKQLSPVAGKVLDKSDVRFQRKCPKTWFLSENGQILDKKGSKNGPNFFVRTKTFIDHF